MSKSRTQDSGFLPDFGTAGVALRILVLAQIIAVVITISRNGAFNAAAWHDLALVSSFVQLIAIGSIVTLKFLAYPVRQMSEVAGAATIFCALLGVTAVVTELIIYALFELELTAQRWPDWHPSLLVRNLFISAVINAFALRYMIVYHRGQLDLESKQAAKLQALQSRIRPHFLFNSMNSVAGLIRHEPAKAEKVLQDLADLFRVLLADARKLVPITAETEVARQYLDIEKLRLGDRLHVKWRVSNVPRSAMIPSLVLQPLLENAIYHGIEPSFGGGTINVEMWTEGNTFYILITNPLPEVRNAAHHKGNKIALDNIRERLTSHFGEGAGLQNFEQSGNYHVKIKMPVVKG